MYKSRCAVQGCTEHPMWEIVWSNGQLYDVCDEHARLTDGWRYDAAADGSLHPVTAQNEVSAGQAHRQRRASGSLLT
jgi:hypothetical protein